MALALSVDPWYTGACLDVLVHNTDEITYMLTFMLAVPHPPRECSIVPQPFALSWTQHDWHVRLLHQDRSWSLEK